MFCFKGGNLPTECLPGQSLAEVLSSSPSNKDETVAEGKDPLVPTKLRQAPPSTAQVFWPSSRTFASPGAAIDAINMIYTKYSPAGTDYLLCKLTRCEANPRGGPFPIPLPGINDGPECQPS